MPRTARLVVPGVPHHVIQRGNRRQDVFFSEDDFRMYLSLLRDEAESGEFAVNAYCLMRNHIHLIVTPMSAQGLRRIGETHKRYTRYINKKMQWQGHLWQDRFGSYPMDEKYCYEAVRYVEMNPVAAGICQHPTAYRWSSARQRVGRENSYDFPVASLPCFQFATQDWEAYWRESIQRHEITQEFIQNEQRLKPLGTFAEGTLPQRGHNNGRVPHEETELA